MATPDLMSADLSPGKVLKKAGVRRVNNVPLFLMLAALGVFLIVMVLVASDRAAKQKVAAKPAAEKGGGDSSRSAKDIIGDRQDGVVKAKPPGMPAIPSMASADITISPVESTAANLDLPPLPPPPVGTAGTPGTGAASMPPPRDDATDRIRQAKLARLDEAVRAKTKVTLDATRSGGSPIGTPATREEALARIAATQQQANEALASDPTAAYRARIAQLQAAGIVPAGSGGMGVGSGTTAIGGSTPSLLSPAGQANDLGQFHGPGGDRWRLDTNVQAPRSRYELRAGFVIPATLISGINSDLPGQIVAQVSQNVFDTATGDFKLIPQGSRLVGAYSSSVAYGQQRVLVAWQRIVFPDGKALDIGSMPGADAAGYSGFSDQVNNHYMRIFGPALLMSGVVAGVAQSQPSQNSSNAPSAGSALSEALGQQLGQAAAQMISKNLNIAPTLEIRPGFRFNVIVMKDLTFSKPYASFDY